MIRSRVVSIGLAAIVLASPAAAKCAKDGALICGKGASSVASDGPLQVSHGGDFAPVGSGAPLQSGDRVLVGGSAARLALGPSCRASLGAGSLVSIQAEGNETCASITQQTGEVLPPEGGVNPLYLGAGALLAGGGIAAAVVLSNNGNGNGNVGGGGGGGSVSSR